MKKQGVRAQDSESTVQIGLLLKPLIEQSVKKLSGHEKAALRKNIIRAQRHLLDLSLGPWEKIELASKELQAIASFGNTWRIISSKIRDYGEDSLAVSLALGLILQVLQEQASDSAA